MEFWKLLSWPSWRYCISVDPYYLIEFAKEKKILLKTLITSRR